MFEEYLAGILAGCLAAGMGWLLPFWKPSATVNPDE